MTRAVHRCPVFSVGYASFGNTCPRNRSQIFVLRLPERAALSTRVHPMDTLSRRKVTR